MEGLTEGLSGEHTAVLVRVAVLILIGLPVIFILRSWTKRFVTRRFNVHYGLLAGKTVFYIGFVLIFIMILHDLGFSLGPLLGAAGIMGVAIGFASQTSVSNIISGLFLIAEQSFVVGDVITVNDKTGVVLSIDTLSVKIRLFNNQYVRIPNETMIKTEVTNVTRFPIRRVGCKVSVAYKEDLSRVREILFDVAAKIPVALQEPEPMLIFDGFGSSSIDLLFVAWAQKSEFLKLRNTLNFEIKKRFDEEGIEIPFPHISVYKGLESEAFPVVVKKDKSG